MSLANDTLKALAIAGAALLAACAPIPAEDFDPDEDELMSELFPEGECEDKGGVDLTGTVARVFPNQAGGWSLAISNPRSNGLDIADAIGLDRRPPPRCTAGARLNACVEADEVFFDIYAPGRVLALSCE